MTVSGVPRSSSIVSSARKSGSGFITIPGPPPYGTSSTTRCRSVVKSRRSRTFTSSVPRSIARFRMPAATSGSTIAGKIVTMSTVIQFKQSIRRFNHDPLGADVDRRADVRRQRNQNLAALTVDDQAAAGHFSFDTADDANRRPVARLDATADEIVPVEHSRRQLGQL